LIPGKLTLGEFLNRELLLIVLSPEFDPDPIEFRLQSSSKAWCRGCWRAREVSHCTQKWIINHILDSVAELAGGGGRTPHGASQAMGRRLIKKTGDIASVQRRLRHKNAAYSMRHRKWKVPAPGV